MTKTGLIVCIALGVVLSATTASALPDSLQGSTTGTRSGGQFVTGGWQVTATTNSIYWHLPYPVSSGIIIWRVKGLAPNAGGPAEAELFGSYDYLYGSADTSSTGYQDNPYKHYVKKYGASGAVPNALHVYWKANGAVVDANTAALDWDPSVDYEFVETWIQDCYVTNLSLSRNGVQVFSGTLSASYSPPGHAVRIGSSPGFPGRAPVNAIFSYVDLEQPLCEPPFVWVMGPTVTCEGDTHSLAWTNPYSYCNFTGTMIRYRTDTYPTDMTDGILVCDRPAARGSVDHYSWTVDPNTKYYYSAFAHDATGGSTGFYNGATALVPAINAPNWLDESFDSYAPVGLGGQGRWVTTGPAGSLVESSFANGGAGKAVLIDATTSSTKDDIAFKDKISGSGTYCYVTADVAVEATGADGEDVAYLSVLGSNPMTEVARLRIQKGKLQLEYGSGSLASITATDDLTWYKVRIGINNHSQKLDVSLNGISVGTGYAWRTYASGISKIVVGGDRNSALSVQKAYIDNIRVEPALSVNTYYPDGQWWPSIDRIRLNFSPVAEATGYRYAIGTAAGGTDVKGWTDCGTSTDILVTGLSLEEDHTYYRSVQCSNLFGTWGPTWAFGSIKVAPGLSRISDAKQLPDGGSNDFRALRGKVVTAKIGSDFYIQEPGSPVGIGIDNSALVAPGDIVDVCGIIKGSGNERYIYALKSDYIMKTTPSPVVVPDAAAMANPSLGGAILNAYTPGVVGGNSANNIGLLVTVWGKVTQRQTTNPKYFYIDDGSKLSDGTTTGGVANVGVRVLTDPAGYATDSYVAVTGISSCFDSSGLRREVLPTTITILRP